jgi:hypothetical protein
MPSIFAQKELAMIPRTDLQQLMQRWAFHHAIAENLATQIEGIVLAQGESVTSPDAVASYSEGRGSYDYEAMAKGLRVPGELIALHTTTVTDWRAVCGALGVPDHIRELFYTPAAKGPRVTLKRAR